jgi:pyruvoyl-dependent arginine decarboxylase (PvlArgDC)
MTRGEHLAHSISFALSKARKVMRGLWFGLAEKERWDVASKTVEHLKEHGDRWRLNEEVESPVVEAHSTPSSFTEAHNQKQDRS